MGKIDTLNGYIEECDKVIYSKEEKEAEKLLYLIAATYISEIPDLAKRLPLQHKTGSLIFNLNILRSILVNHKDNLELEAVKEKQEQKKESLQTLINVENKLAAYTCSSADATVTVSITNAIERLQALPNTISQEDKEELEEKLTALQVALDNRDNDKAKLKLTNVLKYIGDKCVDAGIAVLPYLGQIAATL